MARTKETRRKTIRTTTIGNRLSVRANMFAPRPAPVNVVTETETKKRKKADIDVERHNYRRNHTGRRDHRSSVTRALEGGLKCVMCHSEGDDITDPVRLNICGHISCRDCLLMALSLKCQDQ